MAEHEEDIGQRRDLGQAERFVNEVVFGDEAFKRADPTTKLEMARVRMYQQVGILVYPGDEVTSQELATQAEIAGQTITVLQECFDAFLQSNSPPTQEQIGGPVNLT